MRCTPVGSPDTYRVLQTVARSLTVEGFRELPGGGESLRPVTVRLPAMVARFGGGSGRRFPDRCSCGWFIRSGYIMWYPG